MTIEQMRERKRELGYSYQKIAEISGVPVGTVQKVLGGITKSPREETIWALEAVLKPVIPESTLSEMVEYSEDGSSQHPGRAERIDGVFYEMTSPTSIHQIVIVEIVTQIASYIKAKKGRCVPIVAPMDVQLDCDDRTMVQPDLLVVCDRSKIREKVVYGAPDFLVEVLSLSSRRRDMSIKMSKYAEAGVREYWLVDPDKKRVLVYPLEQEELPMIYGFQDRVPVGIFGGECCVDFAVMDEYIKE